MPTYEQLGLPQTNWEIVGL